MHGATPVAEEPTFPHEAGGKWDRLSEDKLAPSNT